ncbi:MAG TPA: sensor histidine kinase [Kofleriaceae bacterium]
MSNAISEHLRDHKRRIAGKWTTLARDQLPLLSVLEESALLDQIPEIVDALATWIERDTRITQQAFAALADGHAIQRLQRGIDLATLTREYALLRHTIVTELMATQTADAIRETMPRIHDGLDEAMQEAVRRYAKVRDDVLDRIVEILTDDLRKPVDSIAMASVGIMAATDPGDTLYRAGTKLSRSVERIVQVVGDVVELARGQVGGSIVLTRSACDLAEITRDTVGDLLLADPRRSIRIDSHGDVKGHWDHDRVRQAVTYLVTNALQHGDDPIHVVVSESADHETVAVTVTNSGPVIAPDRVVHLFDPLSSPGSTSTRGIGLGLYVVRRIALAHGGRCEVSSNQRDGTSFTLVLPRNPLPL